MLLCNHFYILYTSFDVYEVKYGGVVWVWGIIKENGTGGWWNPMIFILSLSSIFDKICASNFLCRRESSFLPYSAKNPAKIPCFYDSLVKSWFLLIVTHIFDASKFPRAPWLYDVTVTSYEVQWYLFWYQWIEEVRTYTLVANTGVSGVSYRKSREGVATTPFWRTCYKKYLRRTRVKGAQSYLFNFFSNFWTFAITRNLIFFS